jgi:ribosomal protein S18 acetylase RimI-like enzyme
MNTLKFRIATINDLPFIIRLLADDFLGANRERLEDPLPKSYLNAFREIDADANQELIVAELGGDIIGTLQLIVIPSLSYQGGKRSSVESVRVDSKYRGKGIGREMMLLAIERAKERGCISMQLTSHGDRTEAHRFYERLGFSSSHVGMKLSLK